MQWSGRIRRLSMVPLPAFMIVTASAPAQSPPAPAPARVRLQQAVDEEAERQFRIFTRIPVPAGQTPHFSYNIDYPATRPAARTMPWDGTNFQQEPEVYLRKVLAYCLEEAEDRDFDFAGSRRWFHAPWLAREPLRGLTSERRSEPGELSRAQRGYVENFAVGYYNDYGGWTMGQVWRDRGNPQAAAARFPVGTVSCKLLFTRANPAQVPYIRGSLIWKVARRGAAVDFRLLQLDVAVRDSDADRWTGWVFGTFMYLGRETGTPPPFRFADLTPVTLMWGNDPSLGPVAAAAGSRPVEGWVNPAVAAKFRAIRAQTSGLRTDLGLFGRGNGPVDNPASACLACHGRALDGGTGWTAAERGPALPFVPRPIDVGHDSEVRFFFRNLRPDQPFLADTPTRRFTSLDYSLQLAVGLENYHAWRSETVGSSDLLNRLMVVGPLAADAVSPGAVPIRTRSWIDLVPDAEEPKRGDRRERAVPAKRSR